METGLNEISKRLQTSLIKTHESIKNQEHVNPEVLKQIVEDIGAIKEKSGNATQVHMANIAPNIEEAIDSLTAIELMVEKMKEKETDSLVQSIRKVIIGELEESARGEVGVASNFQITYQFFHDQKVDLKKFLRAKQKVEKVYKPKT